MPTGQAPAATARGDGEPAPQDRAQEDRAKARAARAAARAAARSVPPKRRPEYAHLNLAQLRHFRQALMEEEQRVSYWRRILQAKLDTVRERESVRAADVASLRPVLTTERMNRGRVALVSFLPTDDIPPLPDLGRLWETATPLHDPDRLAALERDLEQAESALSRYRRSLHGQIDGVTADLVARYRQDPSACLVALPISRPQDGTAGPHRRG
jgi:hypothetical protein